MDWLYNGKSITDEEVEGYYGFIYEITNNLNGRKYIGRKFFTKSKTKQVKGKKKKLRVESDWKDYWSSCEELLNDIETHGKENFTREVLRLCKTLGECKYQETKIQFAKNVLEERLDNGEWAWYNGNILVKYTRRNIGKI